MIGTKATKDMLKVVTYAGKGIRFIIVGLLLLAITWLLIWGGWGLCVMHQTYPKINHLITDYTQLIDYLDTGDLMLSSSYNPVTLENAGHAFGNFLARTVTYAEWTHIGVVVKDYEKDEIYVWQACDNWPYKYGKDGGGYNTLEFELKNTEGYWGFRKLKPNIDRENFVSAVNNLTRRFAFPTIPQFATKIFLNAFNVPLDPTTNILQCCESVGVMYSEVGVPIKLTVGMGLDRYIDPKSELFEDIIHIYPAGKCPDYIQKYFDRFMGC
jgi:hypothetical protein